MADAFYPFVGAGPADERTQVASAQHASVNEGDLEVVTYPTRIAIFDDAAAAPRVVVIQPKDVRSYLEEITATVTRLAKEQGGKISFTVIREVVENLVHAYFIEPTISILNGGNTIRFSDQGPGIKEKDRALEYGTTSATEQMKKYIRGVGSGLPYAQQYMEDHGGSLTIEDNLNAGTIVTISMPGDDGGADNPQAQDMQTMPMSGQAFQTYGTPGEMNPTMAQPSMGQPYPQQGWSQQIPPQTAGYYTTPQTGTYPAYPQMPPQQMPQYQQWGQPGWPAQVTYPAQGMPNPWQAARPNVANQLTNQGMQLSERARCVLTYLAEHESVGPTDLMNAYGESMPTWSRQLKELEDQGVIRKQGQKRYLTELGRTLL